jgi:hypothetical protein
MQTAVLSVCVSNQMLQTLLHSYMDCLSYHVSAPQKHDVIGNMARVGLPLSQSLPQIGWHLQ